MKSFRELLSEMLLNEMAFKKAEMTKKIESLEEQINLHLIKIIRFEDFVNTEKHINDIMNWLETIQGYNWNKNQQKFSSTLYFEILFKNPIGINNVKYITDCDKRKLKNYQNLPKKCSPEKTILELEKIQKEISILLSRDEIEDVRIDLEKLSELKENK